MGPSAALENKWLRKRDGNDNDDGIRDDDISAHDDD